MGTWQWLLDLLVSVLLAATLLRARRLDRALTALRSDRGAMEALLGGFDSSTQQARDGIERLCDLAGGAVRQVEQQREAAVSLRDDLAQQVERGERLAERLDHALRAMRAVSPPVAEPARPRPRPPQAITGETDLGRVRSQAERDLLMALQARS